MYYNLTQLQSMRCYGKIALRVAAILSAQFCTRLAAAQDWPIHTASKCRMPWPTSSASVVGMAASKLRRCTLFMPSAAPVRLAAPMQVGYPLWGTCRNPHDTPAKTPSHESAAHSPHAPEARPAPPSTAPPSAPSSRTRLYIRAPIQSSRYTPTIRSTTSR